MAGPSTKDHVDRIAERLRRDHPDPAQREKLYAEGKLPDYVRALMPDDAGDIEDVIAGVRAAEDGTPAHDE